MISTDASAYRGRGGVHRAGVYHGGAYRGAYRAGAYRGYRAGAYRGVARGAAIGVGAAAAGAAAYGAYGAYRCGYYPYGPCYWGWKNSVARSTSSARDKPLLQDFATAGDAKCGTTSLDQEAQVRWAAFLSPIIDLYAWPVAR